MMRRCREWCTQCRVRVRTQLCIGCDWHTGKTELVLRSRDVVT